MRKAILHIDGDGFFASCEISLNPALRGKPVVTGQERGIATAMSPEAKKLGVSRGMPIFQVKKNFPQVVVVNSNYHSYGIFAQRMYDIVTRYTDQVEEYSIDECFALLHDSEGATDLVAVAREIKETLQKELGMTFSLGLAPTKVLAKVASKWNKPDGFTVITHADIEAFLKDMLVSKVWGIGPAQSQHLYSIGIKTALELIQKPLEWINATQHKHIRELWHELGGQEVYKVHHERDDDQASIQKTRTFTPPTQDKEKLFSELAYNVEAACQKARHARLVPSRVYYFLKTQEFRYHRHEIVLTIPTTSPHAILNAIKDTFDTIYREGVDYRATGVTLSDLRPVEVSQNDLFGEVVENQKWIEIYKIADLIDRRYGSRTIRLASSQRAYKRRGARPTRLLKIPYMGEVL